MARLFEQFKKNKKGAIALLLVIMITALTLVSSIVLSMANTSDLVANYHFSEAVNVDVGIDSCIEDAMYRVSSSSDLTGSYAINLGDTNCSYDIGATANGMKYVTSTASTTSGVGSWTKTVVAIINVSTSPISIESYKDSASSFDSFIIQDCGNGSTEGTEVCDDGNTVDETQTCGNGVVEGGTSCNADCSAVLNLTQETCDTGAARTDGCGNWVVETAGDYCNTTCNGTTTISVDEVCDDGDTHSESSLCGNGSQEWGTFCNADCSAEIVLDEACDSDGTGQCPLASGYYEDTYDDSFNNCFDGKFRGTGCNLTCTACISVCNFN